MRRAVVLLVGIVAACGSGHPPAGHVADAPDSGTSIPPSVQPAGKPDDECDGVAPPPVDDGLCIPKPGDADGDGFSVEQGDCDDNDCGTNPGAFDVAGN